MQIRVYNCKYIILYILLFGGKTSETLQETAVVVAALLMVFIANKCNVMRSAEGLAGGTRDRAIKRHKEWN